MTAHCNRSPRIAGDYAINDGLREIPAGFLGPVDIHLSKIMDPTRNVRRWPSNRRTAGSLLWRLALKSRLRQQSIPVGDMDALQCLELIENRPRNCAIEAPLFVT